MEERKRNTRLIIALVAVLLTAGVIGATLAYFGSQQTFTNIFQTKPYSTEFTENFTSPEHWMPGETTPKTVTVKNTGGVDVAVRVSYEEEWINANGNKLSGTQGENKAAIINLTNEESWTYSDGYYYYNEILATNESTNSFIESVTFNSAIESDYTCTGSSSNQTCTSTGNGYDGATYKLIIKVETIQADAYQTAWNTTLDIE